MKVLTLISVICILYVSCQETHAQIRIVSRDEIEAVASPRMSPDSAFLSFDTRYIEASDMTEDDAPRTFRFEMKNIGESALDIHRVNTTCSCVTTTVGKTTLEPGESTILTARYDPEGHPGKFERKIFVYTGPGNNPAAVLRLSVDIAASPDKARLYQVQMGSIRMRGKEIIFRRGVKGVEILNFINLSGKSLKLECETMFLPGNISFETRPASVADGQEGMIVISYEPSESDRYDKVPIILKGLGVPPGQSTINIKFE